MYNWSGSCSWQGEGAAADSSPDILPHARGCTSSASPGGTFTLLSAMQLMNHLYHFPDHSGFGLSCFQRYHEVYESL